MQISCGLFCNLARLFYRHAPLPNHHDFYILRDWAWPFNNAPLTRSRPIKFPVRGSTGLNFVQRYHGFSKRRCFSLFSLTAPPPSYSLCHSSHIIHYRVQYGDRSFNSRACNESNPCKQTTSETFQIPFKAFSGRWLLTVNRQNCVIFEFSKLRANIAAFEKENISWNVQIWKSLRSMFLLPRKENYQTPESCINWREGAGVGVKGSTKLTWEMFFNKSLNTTATNHSVKGFNQAFFSHSEDS